MSLHRKSPHSTAPRSKWPCVRRGSGFNSKLISGGHWELKQVVESLIKDEHMQSGTSNFREWQTAADSGGLSSPGRFLIFHKLKKSYCSGENSTHFNLIYSKKEVPL